MQIKFSKITLPKTGSLVVLAEDGAKLLATGQKLDKTTNKALSRAAKAAKFQGKKDKCMSVLSPAGTELDRIVCLGLGKGAELSAYAAEKLGGNLYQFLNEHRVDHASVVIEAPAGLKMSVDELAARVAHGARLRSYRFDKYRTKEKEDAKPTLKSLTFMLDESLKASTGYGKLDKIADGVFLARDLVSEPPNVLFPKSFADSCKKLKELGVKVEVLGEAEMKKLGMGSLLGVGQGSERESQLVVMQWNGGAKSAKPVAFVGKGVTFDTGGISIKPSGGMEDMKYDMGGAAAVTGLMHTLAARKAKANVIGIIGLVENMPDGNAQRPSDVVKSMSGQTIEVINTDAEGRLVLADALWYCQDRFKPRFMVNLATLTGAITIALGQNLYGGLFSNNDELSAKLLTAGEKVGERLWRFPMGEEYDRMINSDIADMQNTGTERGAGSITAAQFLERFVNKTPWAHLDIAGMAWTRKDMDIVPKGAVGYGVRLLNQLVADNYE